VNLDMDYFDTSCLNYKYMVNYLGYYYWSTNHSLSIPG